MPPSVFKTKCRFDRRQRETIGKMENRKETMDKTGSDPAGTTERNACRVRRSFSRAAATYQRQARIQDYAAGRLDELFGRVCGDMRLERVLEIGAGSGLLTRRILSRAPEAVYTVNDITDSFSGDYRRWGCRPLIGDAQRVEFPAGQDAVVSSSCLQWMRDLPALFDKVRRSLRSGGVFCFSSFGPDNFSQVRALTGAGLDYFPVEQLVRMLERAGFSVPEAFSGRDTLCFESAHAMLRYFSDTGVNALERSPRVWTPGRLADFERRYRMRYAPADAPLPLTVDYLWVAARKIP